MIEIKKRPWFLLLRLANFLGNILDGLFLVFLFLLAVLFCFAFSYAFWLVPIYEMGAFLGFKPYSFDSADFAKDAQIASLKTMFIVGAAIGFLTIPIWFRRKLMMPLSRAGLFLLIISASPLLLYFFVSVLNLRICVFPVSHLQYSGAAVLGTSSADALKCEAFTSLDGLWADAAQLGKLSLFLALVPLNVALIANIGLLSYQAFTSAKGERISLLWPVRFFANLGSATYARFSKCEVRAILSLIAFSALVPAATVLPILPEPGNFELKTIINMIPEFYKNEPIVHILVGNYIGPGRQLLVLLFIALIASFFTKRWFAAINLILLTLATPLALYFAFNNFYLLISTADPVTAIAFFVALAGWAAYVICYPHFAKIAAMIQSIFVIAARKATKDVSRNERPIIYLRPFSLDHSMVKTIPSLALRMSAVQSRFRTVEECIADAAFGFAPLVALGDNSTSVEPVGAVREYTSNNDWQNRVSELLDDPRGVLFYVGATEATKWEVETIMSNDLIGKTVFILPPDPTVSLQFFSQNKLLLEHFEIDESTLANGLSRGWLALWTDRKQRKKAFSGGRKDELTYRHAVTRALTELR